MKLLIVEDDYALNRGIAISLSPREVMQAYTIEEARQYLHEDMDLIILDINLPDGSGLDLCKEIRNKSQVPVIMLTANDMEVDIVAGLETGADDYITKPFSLMVLRARVNAVLRRKSPENHIYHWNNFSFDFDNMRFLVDGVERELSRTEQKLLKLLVFNRGKTLTRNLLIDKIWSDGAEFVEENALSVAMRRLREKLPGAPIRTVYGIGYVWEQS